MPHTIIEFTCHYASIKLIVFLFFYRCTYKSGYSYFYSTYYPPPFFYLHQMPTISSSKLLVTLQHSFDFLLLPSILNPTILLTILNILLTSTFTFK